MSKTSKKNSSLKHRQKNIVNNQPNSQAAGTDVYKRQILCTGWIMPGIMQITGIRKTIQSMEREGATTVSYTHLRPARQERNRHPSGVRLNLADSGRLAGRQPRQGAGYHPGGIQACLLDTSLGPAIFSRIHLCGTIITCDLQSYREINYNLQE